MENIHEKIYNKHIINNYNSVNTFLKTLPINYDERANLCSLKKKIGEPAGTNISTIITHLVRLG